VALRAINNGAVAHGRQRRICGDKSGTRLFMGSGGGKDGRYHPGSSTGWALQITWGRAVGVMGAEEPDGVIVVQMGANVCYLCRAGLCGAPFTTCAYLPCGALRWDLVLAGVCIAG